jgi:hypothetical protein
MDRTGRFDLPGYYFGSLGFAVVVAVCRGLLADETANNPLHIPFSTVIPNDPFF